MMESAIRVVFDTNVLLSLFVFKDSRFAPLRGEVVCGRWIALTSPACLAEFRRVLNYPLFALDEAQQECTLTAYLGLVQIVESEPRLDVILPKCKDRDDQKFLELSARCQADLLVSKDKALLKLTGRTKLSFRILPPKPACALLESSEKRDLGYI